MMTSLNKVVVKLIIVTEDKKNNYSYTIACHHNACHCIAELTVAKRMYGSFVRSTHEMITQSFGNYKCQCIERISCDLLYRGSNR